jgi:predicted nuclease of restriction endonuclease-like (RecB) superfamily
MNENKPITRIYTNKDYRLLLQEIKQRVYQSQYEALKAVNKELIALYWDIGKSIIARQEKHGWGKSIVENLARDLQNEFPGIHGFSSRNIWYMRTFFITYSRNVKLQPLVAEIGWAHNVVIMERCPDNLEREFYIRMARKFGWSKNVLIHQIDNKTYEKYLLNQTNFNRTLPAEIRNHAKLAVKDEYTFDFLELGPEHSERQLEKAILARLDRFLREMGGAITFVGSQYKLEVADKEYFIDVLLYHRHLRCLLALELKIGEFLPEYVGKMQFYLTALDCQVKAKGESPAIGIIVCRTKNKTIVEYALQQSKKPIGVATYRITAHLPKDLKRELPSPEQVGGLLEEI